MAAERYNVVCLGCEDVWEPLPGTPLYKRAKKRHEEKGFLDALHVESDECPTCQDEKERRVACMFGDQYLRKITQS